MAIAAARKRAQEAKDMKTNEDTTRRVMSAADEMIFQNCLETRVNGSADTVPRPSPPAIFGRAFNYLFEQKLQLIGSENIALKFFRNTAGHVISKIIESLDDVV